MSLEIVTMYRIVCDWPGCTASAQDDGDYYAWLQADLAQEDAACADWWTDATTADVVYCPAHPAFWSSCQEDVLRAKPPFLLIHDDDGCGYEKGAVTLVEVPR